MKQMKQTKITCSALAVAMLVSSCTSSYQAAGGLNGAIIGSHIGSAVGFLSGHGHFRGENAALGSLIGMGIGAVLGVGIASQIEENEKAEANRRYEQQNGVNRRTDDDIPYQTGGGAYNRTTSDGRIAKSTAPSAIVSLSDLTYMDVDGDGYISKDETIEVEGFITNTSESVLRDIIIQLEVSDPKAFSVSPSLTTTLQPGQKIRYTGRVHCIKTRGNEAVGISLNAIYAGKTYTTNDIYVGVK